MVTRVGSGLLLKGLTSKDADDEDEQGTSSGSSGSSLDIQPSEQLKPFWEPFAQKCTAEVGLTLTA